ncbi:hypothetical protein VNO77_27697 [Canavalia gladiata]|uniref:Uncharacterized protein n=1 Tax=Canavalia gladiata TaxID=3824 RepID=A0AAN9KXD8_CANGL
MAQQTTTKETKRGVGPELSNDPADCTKAFFGSLQTSDSRKKSQKFKDIVLQELRGFKNGDRDLGVIVIFHETNAHAIWNKGVSSFKSVNPYLLRSSYHMLWFCKIAPTDATASGDLLDIPYTPRALPRVITWMDMVVMMEIQMLALRM